MFPPMFPFPFLALLLIKRSLTSYQKKKKKKSTSHKAWRQAIKMKAAFNFSKLASSFRRALTSCGLDHTRCHAPKMFKSLGGTVLFYIGLNSSLINSENHCFKNQTRPIGPTS